MRHSQNAYSLQGWSLIGRNDNRPHVVPSFLFCTFHRRYGEEILRGKENSTVNPLSFIRKTEKKLLFLANKCFTFIIFSIKFSSVSERKYQNVQLKTIEIKCQFLKIIISQTINSTKSKPNFFVEQTVHIEKKIIYPESNSLVLFRVIFALNRLTLKGPEESTVYSHLRVLTFHLREERVWRKKRNKRVSLLLSCSHQLYQPRNTY